MSNPWMKFYTSDWRSDPALRMCSLAARGLWIEMICVMHEAKPYGHLLINGHSLTDAQLAVQLGAPPDQITALLGELEMAGVFSRTRAGVIYSRKMASWAKKSATARKNGQKGGNPNLSKERRISASDNPPLNGGDKPQKPEARIQKESPLPPKGDLLGDEPPPKQKAKRSSTRRPYPPDWKPSDKTITILEGEGYQRDFILTEAAGYRDWCIASGVKWVDHEMAFKNKIRKKPPPAARRSMDDLAPVGAFWT